MGRSCDISDVIASATPESPWFDRRLAIMETGYSTNSFLRDELEQSHYFESIQEFIARLNMNQPESVRFVGYMNSAMGIARHGSIRKRISES